MIETKMFSFSKVVNALYKALSTANQLLPLYQQAQPIIKNTKKIVKVFNNINTKRIIEITDNKKNTSKIIYNNSNPVFFQ